MRTLSNILVLLFILGCDSSQDNTAQRNQSFNQPSFSFQAGTEVFGDAISENDKTYDVIVDSSGNIYTSGYTEGNFAENNAGSRDIILTKFSASGAHLWSKQIGDESFPGLPTEEDRAQSLAFDNSGNIILTAYTKSSIIETNPNEGTEFDNLIIKLNPDGEYIWIKQWGAESLTSAKISESERAFGVITDSNDNIFFTGYTDSNIDETGAGADDVYVAKLDSGGSIQWITHFGSTTIGNYGTAANKDDRARFVFLDSTGNLYVIGSTKSSLGETNGGSFDIFIAKLNSSGTLQWIKQLGDTTLGSAADGYDRLRDAKVDSDMNFYITGYTNGSFAEDYGGGDYDAFVLKVNSSGDLIWRKQLGNETIGARANGEDIPSAIELGDDGNIYLAGYTYGNLGETNGGDRDIFWCKFNSSGELQSLKHFGYETFGSKSAGDDVPLALSKDAHGFMYLIGNTTSDMNGTAQNADIFILKFNPDGSYDF